MNDGRDYEASIGARLRVLWRARYWIALVTVVATLGTYVVSKRVPGTYRAGAQVLVTTLSPGGITQASVEASNSLATQYAELVPGDGVLQPVADKLGIPIGELQASVSAGTVSAQNIIAIAAEGPSPAAASERADAVARSFVSVQKQANQRLITSFEQTAANGSKGLQHEIDAVKSQVADSTGAAQTAAEAELAELEEQRATETAALVEGGAQSLPTVSVLAYAGAGAEILPRPSLFAVLACLLSFLLSCQAVVALARRRSRIAVGGMVKV